MVGFELFGVHTWNGNAGPYGNSMFHFLRNCQTEKHRVLRVTKSQARISGFLLATQCRPEELSGSSVSLTGEVQRRVGSVAGTPVPVPGVSQPRTGNETHKP